ncbi:hypothetical protein Hdeb2414_s0911g00960171 [Helianthus debilis subsp. tardiflorus]
MLDEIINYVQSLKQQIEHQGIHEPNRSTGAAQSKEEQPCAQAQ